MNIYFTFLAGVCCGATCACIACSLHGLKKAMIETLVFSVIFVLFMCGAMVFHIDEKNIDRAAFIFFFIVLLVPIGSRYLFKKWKIEEKGEVKGKKGVSQKAPMKAGET